MSLLGTICTMLLILGSCTCTSNEFDRLCSRMFFGSMGERWNPYVNLLNGVYVKTEQIIDGFPLYMYERGGAYFRYSSSKELFLFTVGGTEEEKFAGIAAQSDPKLISDPKKWLPKISNETKLFGGTLKQWYRTDPSTKKSFAYYSMDPKCVDFTDCQMGDLQFLVNVRDGNKSLNDPITDYFQMIPNKFVESRPVYQHSNFEVTGWYLFFYRSWRGSPRWIIGSDYTSSNAYWMVEDEALKAEFITNKWNRYDGRRWIPFEKNDVRIQCRGMVGVRCSDVPCTSCREDFAERAKCTCPMGKTGMWCTQKEQLCDGEVTSKSMQVNSAYGSLASRICPEMTLGYKSVICERKSSSASLQWVGEPCKRPNPAPKPKRFNFDEHPALKWMLVFAPIFVPLVFPFIHWFLTQRKRSLFRLVSIYAYLTGICSAVLVFWYYTGNLNEYGKNTFEIVSIMAIISLCSCYILVLVESFISHEVDYLNEVSTTEDIRSYLIKLTQTKPRLSTFVKCWHNETRYRTVTYKDSQGFTQTSRESYQEPVTTWSGTEDYEFKSWTDLTDISLLPTFDESRLTRLKLSVDIRFKDEDTRLDFLMAQQRYVDSNRGRDQFIHYETQQHIDGLRERSLLPGKFYTRPWWLCRMCYWASALLFMTWPYRLMFRMHTKQVQWKFAKQISFIYSPSAPPIIPDTIATDAVLLTDRLCELKEPLMGSNYGAV